MSATSSPDLRLARCGWSPPWRPAIMSLPARSADQQSALRIATVELLYRDRVQIDIFKTANIDRDHAYALRIDTFTKGMNAAAGAKAMLNHMLVEGVSRDVIFCRQQLHAVAREVPQQRALALAD